MDTAWMPYMWPIKACLWFGILFNTKFNMNKGVRLEYGDSLMTHAMLFTGVDIKNGKPIKWRVENSWGNKSGDKGYYLMNDSWFNEYNYEVVIDKKYLSKKIINLFTNLQEHKTRRYHVRIQNNRNRMGSRTLHNPTRRNTLAHRNTPQNPTSSHTKSQLPKRRNRTTTNQNI